MIKFSGHEPERPLGLAGHELCHRFPVLTGTVGQLDDLLQGAEVEVPHAVGVGFQEGHGQIARATTFDLRGDVEEDGLHPVDLVLHGHGEVNHHCAAFQGLRELLFRDVRDEDDLATECDRRLQVGIFFVREPGNGPDRLVLKDGLHHIGADRILEAAVAVIHDDGAVSVVVDQTVEGLGRDVALDDDVVSPFLLASGPELGHDGVGFSEATFAGDDRRLGVAGKDHIRHYLDELEAAVDVVFGLLRDGCLSLLRAQGLLRNVLTGGQIDQVGVEGEAELLGEARIEEVAIPCLQDGVLLRPRVDLVTTCVRDELDDELALDVVEGKFRMNFDSQGGSFV